MKETYIDPTAIVYAGVRIGEGCYIGPYCVIGAPPEIREGFIDHRTGQVDIGNNVVLTGFATIDSGSNGNRTVIGDDCFLMKRVHIGHDCIIYPGVTIAVGTALAGHVIVGKDANIGLLSAVHQFCRIPAKVMIAMKAAVTKKAAADMCEAETWGGIPARKLGMNKRWITK